MLNFDKNYTQLQKGVNLIETNSVYSTITYDKMKIYKHYDCHKLSSDKSDFQWSSFSWAVEYIRKHAVRLLRLREQHTPPRSVVVIVISLQLMHFLIHISWWKVSHYLSLSLLLLLGPETKKYTVSIELN